MSRCVRVRRLFRYPVKGFTGEDCDRLDVLPGGRIAGDRVLGLRFDDEKAEDDAWSSKAGFLALVHTPVLAALRLRFDAETSKIRLAHRNDVLFDDVLDDTGRRRFASTVERFLSSVQDPSVAAIARRFPLRLAGNGKTPRFQDREPGFVTLHGRPSIAAVATAVDEDAEVTERRFRSNIVIDGLEAWDEQRWVGGTVRIGDVAFDVVNPVTRCLATHANPDSGQRDRAMMQELLHVFPAARPTLGVLMTSERGGVVRVGDDVRVAGVVQ